MGASYEVRGQVAVITLNNPPVNGLGHATRLAVAEGVEGRTFNIGSGREIAINDLAETVRQVVGRANLPI